MSPGYDTRRTPLNDDATTTTDEGETTMAKETLCDVEDPTDASGDRCVVETEDGHAFLVLRANGGAELLIGLNGQAAITIAHALLTYAKGGT